MKLKGKTYSCFEFSLDDACAFLRELFEKNKEDFKALLAKQEVYDAEDMETLELENVEWDYFNSDMDYNFFFTIETKSQTYLISLNSFCHFLFNTCDYETFLDPSLQECKVLVRLDEQVA